MGKTYKVQIYTDTTDNTQFKDFYIDVDSITGCYAPDEDPEFPREEGGINIFHEGGLTTILKEKHIGDYLYDRFVKDCVELNNK